MVAFSKKINFIAECRELRWGLWQCPPFLFLVMGFITIISMVATYVLASRYIDEPEIAALIVIFVTILFLVIGNVIINGFNRIAETNRMKSEFISLISHQLRSPLSIFKWTLDVLERDFRRIDHAPEEDNFLKTLRTTSEGMIGLVNSLLEMSRIEAQTFALRNDVFSLEKVTRDIMENFMKYAEASNIALALEVSGNLPTVRSDKDRVAIVVQNLVDNAIRYSKKTSTVSIKINSENSFIRWSIHDQGIGIPVPQQKQIFQKFFRADNIKESQANTHGSGIGLYIAKEIINASGGQIGFDSREGGGTMFWFTLPVAKATGHT